MNVKVYFAFTTRLIFTLLEQLSGDLHPCCSSVWEAAVSWVLANVNYCPTCVYEEHECFIYQKKNKQCEQLVIRSEQMYCMKDWVNKSTCGRLANDANNFKRFVAKLRLTVSRLLQQLNRPSYFTINQAVIDTEVLFDELRSFVLHVF